MIKERQHFSYLRPSNGQENFNFKTSEWTVCEGVGYWIDQKIFLSTYLTQSKKFYINDSIYFCSTRYSSISDREFYVFSNDVFLTFNIICINASLTLLSKFLSPLPAPAGILTLFHRTNDKWPTARHMGLHTSFVGYELHLNTRLQGCPLRPALGGLGGFMTSFN